MNGLSLNACHGFLRETVFIFRLKMGCIGKRAEKWGTEMRSKMMLSISKKRKITPKLVHD